MVLLGWAVRTGPVPIDMWFQRLGHGMGSFRHAFLVFSEPIAVTVALLIGVIVAVRRRRTRLALAMVVSPLLAIGIVRICKPIFGREKGGDLAYPSGHTTFLVTVAGLLVLLAGVALWAVMVALTVSLLGMFGLSMTFHYFTDTIGGLLLGTSVVCVVAILARAEPAPRS
ncbi:phosphatase PAP2 family protein [Mycobacterium sp. CBMA247]|nr:phosphatase PAP2 family protein [Mycolicibacterium sp. CBMA 329]MUL87553.1 phosphatase PAP2 family protein [Mycolicibacterium sp. CBMA 331]MUL99583.1 phosphatase PAP2 family protein [Mycolicibacterium sp. CBMA 334]MUM26681.1 phosphatase PAP2 family protein [Mycolicibacterium sp. CBMA 295]MUM37850.1 phosphatase PAP2 family protein [Mycolicibacterium sp. CBMA 247]MUM43618.1 phosphatase PAP2 family protein [Mycolicibacterium sp. CBMA 294]